MKDPWVAHRLFKNKYPKSWQLLLFLFESRNFRRVKGKEARKMLLRLGEYLVRLYSFSTSFKFLLLRLTSNWRSPTLLSVAWRPVMHSPMISTIFSLASCVSSATSPARPPYPVLRL